MFETAELWQPIRLTLELAAITTVILLIVGTPIAWWLARSTRAVEGGGRDASWRCRSCCRRRCSASTC